MDNKKPKESVIRLMTRLANKNRAINLSQGFTDNPIIFDMLWGSFVSSLGGIDSNIDRLNKIKMQEIAEKIGINNNEFMGKTLREVFSELQGSEDVYNQYCYPFGLTEMRKCIAQYTKRFRNFYPDPEEEITVVSGATEGIFVVLKTICEVGDEIIVIQPFHEMYPSQAMIAEITPKYVTLKKNAERRLWEFNFDEFEQAITKKTKALIFNSPHNPTGKVFTEKEIQRITEICKKNNIFVISDEIYEHILFNDNKHYTIAGFEGMRERTFIVNSVSKTGNATGWRIGWVISPSKYTKIIRGLHDTMVMQAPTPLQKGAIELLKMPDDFYYKLPEKYQENCNLLFNTLEDVGFEVMQPQGAYYLFADYSNVELIKNLDAMNAAIYLIEKVGVATVPGNNFYKEGNYGDKTLRFAFCRGIKSIEEAAQRLRKLKK